MATVTELKNEAAEALETAKAILEERAEAKEQEARDNLASRYKRAWSDYEAKAALLKDAEAAEAATAALGAEAKDTPKPSDLRNPKDADWIKDVTPERANELPSGHIRIADGVIVPVASKDTEGYIRRYPVAVQHPSIMQRYGPDLRAEKAKQEEAFAVYMRRGLAWLKENRPDLAGPLKALNALQEDADTEGGYLVPTDQRMELIFDPGAPGGVTRPESARFTTTRDGGTWPTLTDGDWIPIAEEASPSNTDPSFGQVPFTIRKSGVNTILSDEVVADAGLNLFAVLGASWTRISGRYEDQQAIEGDGATEPLGIRTPGAPQGNVADITDLLTLAGPTVAEIVNAWSELPAQFRAAAIWHITSSFFGTLAAIESSNGGVSFIRELTMSPQRTLMGNRVVMFDGTGWDSGAVALTANNEVGCFGDFRNYYYFVDRVGMTASRDDSRYADTDQILFKARKRYDSFFAENNAFRILKAAAS